MKGVHLTEEARREEIIQLVLPLRAIWGSEPSRAVCPGQGTLPHWILVLLQGSSEVELDHFNYSKYSKISSGDIPKANCLNFEPAVPCVSLLGNLKNLEQ